MRTERPLVENWNMLIGWWEEHFWNMLPTFLLLLSIPCSLQVTKNPSVRMLDQFSKFPPKEKMLDEMSFPGADPSPAATPDSQEWAEHQCHSCPGYNAKDNAKTKTKTDAKTNTNSWYFAKKNIQFHTVESVLTLTQIISQGETFTLDCHINNRGEINTQKPFPVACHQFVFLNFTTSLSFNTSGQ